jgi:hypothetical protein
MPRLGSFGTSSARGFGRGTKLLTVPGLPASVSSSLVNDGTGQNITVSWTAPVDTGGSAITGYSITSDVGGFSISVGAATLTTTFSGASLGTSYHFTVSASNESGNGSGLTTASALLAARAPDAPGSASAVRTGNTDGSTATLSWDIPYDGGSPILYYRQVRSPDNYTYNTNGASSSSQNYSFLVNATTHSWRVYAVNAYGTSAGYAQSNSIAPYTVPSAPIIIGANKNSDGTNASVLFKPSTSDGGSNITSYIVTASVGGASATVVPDGSSSYYTNVTGNISVSTSYTFTVKAQNGIGLSPASAASNATGTNVVANATGGAVISTAGKYRTHFFTASGTFAVSSAPAGAVFEIIMVGGGGGGGSAFNTIAAGGGGGAGGLLYYGATTLTTGNKTIVIGSAGSGGNFTAPQPNNRPGGLGTATSFTGLASANGGGGGGYAISFEESSAGLNGGSGGGGGGPFSGGGGSSTQSAPGYGNPGCGGGDGNGFGGAGGGAGSAAISGGLYATSTAGNGLNVGSFGTYGGGGAGGNWGIYGSNPGGLGGGGAGGSNSPGSPGTPNTGGGGGGAGSTFNLSGANVNGGNGGSGIVIIRYRYLA